MPKSMTTGFAVVQHDVAGLQVAVHDPGRVHGHQRLGQPAGQPLERPGRQRPVLAHHVVQGVARHVPGHDVGELAGHVRVEHLGDERAVDPAHRLDLAGQAAAGVRLLGDPGVQDLDRDHPAIPVAGQVDRSHATFAEPLTQAVRPEPVRYPVLCGHGFTRLRRSRNMQKQTGICAGSLSSRGWAEARQSLVSCQRRACAGPGPPRHCARRARRARWPAQPSTRAAAPGSGTAPRREPHGRSRRRAGRG